MLSPEEFEHPIVYLPCRVIPIVDFEAIGFRHNKKGSMRVLEKINKPVRAQDVLDQINDVKWYRVEEVQALCQVSRKTVYRWIGLCLRSKEHGVLYLKARKCFAKRRWYVLGRELRRFLGERGES